MNTVLVGLFFSWAGQYVPDKEKTRIAYTMDRWISDSAGRAHYAKEMYFPRDRFVDSLDDYQDDSAISWVIDAAYWEEYLRYPLKSIPYPRKLCSRIEYSVPGDINEMLSYGLFKLGEPILYNYYLGTPMLRVSGVLHGVFSLSIFTDADGKTVMVTKALRNLKLPDWSIYVVTDSLQPDSAGQANQVVVNDTMVLSDSIVRDIQAQIQLARLPELNHLEPQISKFGNRIFAIETHTPQGYDFSIRYQLPRFTSISNLVRSLVSISNLPAEMKKNMR